MSTKHIDTCIDSGHIRVVTFWNKVNPIAISERRILHQTLLKAAKQEFKQTGRARTKGPHYRPRTADKIRIAGIMTSVAEGRHIETRRRRARQS